MNEKLTHGTYFRLKTTNCVIFVSRSYLVSFRFGKFREYVRTHRTQGFHHPECVPALVPRNKQDILNNRPYVFAFKIRVRVATMRDDRVDGAAEESLRASITAHAAAALSPLEDDDDDDGDDDEEEDVVVGGGCLASKL